jgi:hypothetical protein
VAEKLPEDDVPHNNSEVKLPEDYVPHHSEVKFPEDVGPHNASCLKITAVELAVPNRTILLTSLRKFCCY